MSGRLNKMIAKKSLQLSKCKKGDRLQIVFIPDGLQRSQLIRFGIIEGDIVHCLENLPGGTTVIQKNRQEIAIGYKFANKIIVTKI